MAVTTTTTARCCANIQISLNETADFAPDRDNYSLGMIEALNSPANRDGFEVKRAVRQFDGISKLDGSDDAVLEVKYELPDCVAASAAEIDICGTLTSVGDTRGYLDVKVEQIAARGGTFTMDEFDAICDTPNARLGRMIRKFARSIKKEMDTKLIASAVTYLSNYSDGTDSADVVGAATKLLNIVNSGGYVNAGEWTKLRSEYRKLFATQDAIIVGGDILAQYNDIAATGGRGANAIGASGNAGIQNPYFVDFNLDGVVESAIAASGANDGFAISWYAGGLQLLELMENVGYKEYFYPQSTRTTINVDGMLFDWRLIFEECPNPVWKFVMSKRYDLFAIPESVYTCAPTTNGVLLWKLGCGDATCPSF